MGVPLFYGWLVRRHPQVVAATPPPHCDNLFVDFSGGVHAACLEVRRREAEFGGDVRAMEEAMLASVVALLRSIYAHVAPRSLFYVALDGVSPCGKLVQQRARRYRKAACAEAAGGGWDANALHIGTEFSVRVHERLERELGCASAYDGCARVVLAGSEEPMEGEQKIARALRHVADGQTSVVYGADADLIFLALLHCRGPSAPVWITRDDATTIATGPCLRGYLDVAAARASLANEVRSMPDFAALFLLAGNDFLPNVPCIDPTNHGFDELLAAYGAARGSLVRPDGALDADVLADVLARLATGEIGRLRRQRARVRRRGGEEGDGAARDAIGHGERGWVSRYYEQSFGWAPSEPHARRVDAACRDYLDTLHWNVAYYARNQPPSWDWCYGRTHAPLARDLARCARAHAPRRMRAGAPHSPALQLACATPLRSFALLPPAVADAIRASPSAARLYPRDAPDDAHLRVHAWQRVPLLPAFGADEVALLRRILAEAAAEDVLKRVPQVQERVDGLEPLEGLAARHRPDEHRVVAREQEE